MSRVLISFIDHKTINHKYYMGYALNTGDKQSTCFWTGIYPEVKVDDIKVCANLAEALLCYDNCIINIDDYLYLVGILGIDCVNALLSEGAIELYNNKEIKASISSMTKEDPFIINFFIKDNFNPEDKVQEFQRIYNISYDTKYISDIQKKIEQSKQVDINREWIDKLNTETTNDLKNPNITSHLGLINEGKIVDRDHDYNQFLYNRIAYLNLYMALENTMSLRNVLLPAEIQSLLEIKLGAYIEDSNLQRAYSSIAQYEGVADVYSLICKGTMNFYDILKIRNNKYSGVFRRWLEDSTERTSSRQAVENYNIAIKEGIKTNQAEGLLSKSLKFIIPTAIGLIPGPVGLAASTAIGTSLYLKDIINKKFKPNIFINDCLKNEIATKMNEKQLRDENAYYKKKYGTISPNDKCPCQSGYKYKKCHGLYNY